MRHRGRDHLMLMLGAVTCAGFLGGCAGDASSRGAGEPLRTMKTQAEADGLDDMFDCMAEHNIEWRDVPIDLDTTPPPQRQLEATGGDPQLGRRRGTVAIYSNRADAKRAARSHPTTPHEMLVDGRVVVAMHTALKPAQRAHVRKCIAASRAAGSGQ